MKKLKRLPDWPVRFHRFIDGVKRDPFEWGGHDCVIGWMADHVLEITGEDVAADQRGKYKSAKGALGIVKRLGFENLGDAVASVLPEIHLSQVRMGDIVLIPSDGPFKASLGIVNGETVLALGEKNMGTVPLAWATRAYAVG